MQAIGGAILGKMIGDEFVPDRGFIPHSFRATFICLARANKVDDMSILNTTGQSVVVQREHDFLKFD